MGNGELVRVDAPGLPADWLNAWLAAIGVTVLLPSVKLSWTDDVIPHAIFWVEEGIDLPEAIFGVLPSADELGLLPTARRHPDSAASFDRNVSLEVFQDRARIERSAHTSTLAATVTDLVEGRGSEVLRTSPFNTPAPGGVTLWERLVACRGEIREQTQVGHTLNGQANRLKGNGLGFDCRRAPGGVPSAPKESKFVDPVIETLAGFGLRLFPVRGNGRRETTRRWTGGSTQVGSFTWFSWLPRLDVWAIDAVLDKAESVARRRWEVVPLKVSNAQDPTRAFFSRPVENGTDRSAARA
jgi:hypothetical protein